ncbi:MerR family transcriptional regulator [Virgibacillus sp. DJP39]|uniref:MerR family transcriptional regulator n=1 Tax=Virgibacillus sp. DJP39 TaxID=3409790 RepID=UPI003BB7036A
MDKNDNQVDKKVDKIEYTIKDASNLVNEKTSIIRNWLRELGEHIPTHKNESGYNVFLKDGIERLREIRSLHRENNYSIKMINHYFATGGKDFIPVKEETGEKVAEELKALREEIRELKEHDKKQTQFNEKLLEELQKQNTYINRSLNERDQKLLEVLEKKKEEKQEKQEKKGFLGRIFLK